MNMRETGCPRPKMNEEKESIEPDSAIEGILVLSKRNTGVAVPDKESYAIEAT